MAKNSESIEERMERNSIGFEQRKIESKKRMDEHRQSVENKSIENNKPSAPPSQKKKNDLTVKVDIDVSDALKGLKAVQREAKKTVQALKEVDVIITTDKPRLYSARYECLLCDHNDCVRNEKKDYREVLVCPKCKGAFVDTYYKNKFNNPKGLI